MNNLSPRRAPGFTLIELALVVALTGLVVTMLLHTLAQVRTTARDLVSMNNMRSHAQIFTAYAAEWRGYVPAITHPDATLSVIRGCGEPQVVPFFHAAYLWNFALCDGSYGGDPRHSSFYHPDRQDELPNVSYLLTASYMAFPPYWAAETRLQDASQLGHGRLSSTTFASHKALLIEWHPARGLPVLRSDAQDRSAVGLALADGSAARFGAKDLIEPYSRGDGGGPHGFLPFGVYGMHTTDGWQGRDRK